MGPTNKNQFFLCYQTLKYVVAGEPHPQPHYQTASKHKDCLQFRSKGIPT